MNKMMKGFSVTMGRANRISIFILGLLSLCFLIGMLYVVYTRHYHSILFSTTWFIGLLSIFSFTFGSMFLNSQRKVQMTMVLTSVIASLYIAELSLTAIGYNSLTWAKIMAANKAGVEFDTRSKEHYIEDLRETGKEVWPSLHPTPMLSGTPGLQSPNGYLYPLGGLSNKHSVLCNEIGDYVTILNDQYGFNNANEVYSQDHLDVALIGDSFTQGVCVDSHLNIAGWMLRRGLSVLNLGNSGNGPLAELGTVKEYASYFRPKVVFWFYYEGNDLFDLSIEKKSVTLSKYAEEGFSQNLLERQNEIDKLWKKKIDTLHIPKKLAFLKLTRLRDLLMPPSVGYAIPKPSGDFKKIIQAAKKEVNEWGGELYFVYLPDWMRYAGLADKTFFHADEVLNMAQDIGLTTIDFSDSLKSHTDPLSLFPYRTHAHYTAEGYSLLANLLIEQLKKDGWKISAEGSFR